ncbi:MAG: T9SS type A sorting domain-containing protein [Bacteroidia bacterium]|nr:T9SS type A sorting domain-containing protein [Bacteroidia bacterium]
MKPKLPFLIALTLLAVLPRISAAQCGVNAYIAVVQNGITQALLNADNSQLTPGWNLLGYQWRVNGLPAGTDSVYHMNHLTPYGLNHITVQITATNPLTGDTCTDEYGNVYMSTAAEPFEVLMVNGTGLTKNLDGYWFGGDPNTWGPFILDYGDGNGTNMANASYTYPAPGSYMAYFDNQNGFLGGAASRKVHVDDGYSDLQNLQFISPTVICDSFRISIATSPPHTGGFMSDAMGIAGMTNAPFYTVNGSTTTGGRYNVPGQSLLSVMVNDSSFSDVQYYYPVFIDDACLTAPDTVSGFVWDDADADGLIDATEAFLTGKSIRVHNYRDSSDTSGQYALLLPHAQSRIYPENTPAANITFPSPNGYQVLYNTSANHSNHHFGITQNLTSISGRMYYDRDGNGSYSPPADHVLRNVSVMAHNTTLNRDYVAVTGNNGIYTLIAPIGNYKIYAGELRLDSAIVLPDTIVLNASLPSYSSQDFACTSPWAGGNLGIDLTPSLEARPGFDYSISMGVFNSGADTCKGLLVLQYDSLLTVLSISPANGSIDPVTHSITWTTSTLNATEGLSFAANFNIPASVALGTVLHFSASVSPLPGYSDHAMNNNLYLHAQTVIGSFDPNDKLVTPQGYGPTGDVHHDTRLHYRINFQNTGTASAINIRVQDIIDDDLDLSTFLMKRTSHPYALVTNGREFTWKFININLPDSNSNEPGSHGFIEYSILPLQGLPDGTVISNTADIYFDFNAPIVTNTVTNTLQTTITSVVEVIKEDGLLVYPNPAGDFLSVEFRENIGAACSLTILSAEGKLLHRVSLPCNNTGPGATVDVRHLEAGMYLLQMDANQRSYTGRFIKR